MLSPKHFHANTLFAIRTQWIFYVLNKPIAQTCTYMWKQVCPFSQRSWQITGQNKHLHNTKCEYHSTEQQLSVCQNVLDHHPACTDAAVSPMSECSRPSPPLCYKSSSRDLNPGEPYSCGLDPTLDHAVLCQF